MNDVKIKKYNIGYILGYIFIPLVIVAVCIALNVMNNWVGTIAVVTLMGIPLLAILFWSLASTLLYKYKQKQMFKELDAKGFIRSHTFNGGSCIVVVNESNGQLALLFRWNPFQTYIFPASRITQAWVDDGAGGIGFMRGSSRVSFLFVVDGVKIRVNTFTSNKRWRMDSNYILTGISKADLMVEILNFAKSREK